MITTFITAQIVWTLLGNTCGNVPNLAGCYEYRTNIIWVDSNLKMKDFYLYHEIGHSLLWKTPWQVTGIFPNEEIVADRFSLYVYNAIYPEMTTRPQPKELEYIKKYCPEKCLNEILLIKIP